jgi:uncharacterized membrane protein YqiK
MLNFIFGIAFGIILVFVILFIVVTYYVADAAEEAHRDGWENPY